MSKTPSKIRNLIQNAAEATSRENLGVAADPSAPLNDRATAAGISRRTQSKLDYLARRRRTDLLEQIQAGTISVDRAYRLAGGAGPKKTLLEQVQRLWQKATPEQRREIAAWIQTQSPAGPDL